MLINFGTICPGYSQYKLHATFFDNGKIKKFSISNDGTYKDIKNTLDKDFVDKMEVFIIKDFHKNHKKRNTI